MSCIPAGNTGLGATVQAVGKVREARRHRHRREGSGLGWPPWIRWYGMVSGAAAGDLPWGQPCQHLDAWRWPQRLLRLPGATDAKHGRRQGHRWSNSYSYISQIFLWDMSSQAREPFFFLKIFHTPSISNYKLLCSQFFYHIGREIY